MTSTARESSNRRLYLLGGMLLLWAGIIGLRLVYLQILRYGEFEQRAQHQQQRTTEVAAKRGVILDRAGRELAMSVAVDSVFAVPGEIHDLASTVSLISHITKDDPRELLARCQEKTFCWVARKADSETADRIRALNLRGIHFQKESKRSYPKRELAAQLIGYVGTDDEGLSGIEREFNDELRGKPGRMLVSVDARKRWFGSVEKQPEPGQSVVLTLDQQIQYIAERELDAAMHQTHAISGTVVVENPRTGEILALANQPTFNPNLSREITPEKLKDHAISDVYEPGSTFKLVTIAAAVDQRLARPDELIDCQRGSIVLFGHRIHDWKPWGVMPVSEVLAESSDVGAIKIALRMGDDRMYKYIRAFGFGQQTGIELPGETRGLTKPLSRWSKISIGAIAMGQEIGISAIQLAQMVSSIANDGVLLPTRIVAGEVQPADAPQTVAFHPAEGRRVVSAETAALMRQMMQGVVLHGTGRKAALEGYSAGGKTGTAQKFDFAKHAYSHTKYVASFAGFAPINNPAIVVVAIFDSPEGQTTLQREGGWVAAPVFQRIAQQVLEYLHIPHDVELPPSRQVLLAQRKLREQDIEEGSPDRLGDALEADSGSLDPTPASRATASSSAPTADSAIVPAALEEREAAPPDEGARASADSAAQAKPAPAASSAPPARGTVVLDVEQGGVIVPSFLGRSVRSAVETAEQSGLDVDVIGSGVAREQSPAAGSHVAAGSTVTVKFQR